jgi:hypothetical protein
MRNQKPGSGEPLKSSGRLDAEIPLHAGSFRQGKFVKPIILYAAIALLYFSPNVSDAEHPALASEILQQAANQCAAFEDGKFQATAQAVTWHDLTGDGRPEVIVDASQFSCSTAASLWGGSGGTYLWAIVEGRAYGFLAHNWRVVDLGGQQVLLLAVHSSECGDTVGPCYRALVWRDGFRTTR